VTFLLDKKGVVRRVHPGGQYVQGDAGYAELRASIEELLAEKGEGAPASEAGLKPRAQGAATKVGGI
jgi:hypothetical protein